MLRVISVCASFGASVERCRRVDRRIDREVEGPTSCVSNPWGWTADVPRSSGVLEAVGLVMMALWRVGFRLGAAAGDNSPAAWNSGSRPLRRRERRGRSTGIGSYVREMLVDYI